jgi:DNA-binding PadR family transcriptional regulator
MRRGDIRTALLVAVAENPGHGYDVIRSIEEKSGGAWKPSPGSVYPTLQMLEDEGLMRSVERDGKRVYEVTDAGREEATRRVEEAGGTPWELAAKTDSGVRDLHRALAQLHFAGQQLTVAGSRDQVQQAAQIVDNARKQLYQLLAE